MIVACPNCQTQFEFDASRVTAASIKVKCSRCRAVFPAPFDKKQAPGSSPTKKRSRPAVDSLELPFEESDWKEGNSAEEDLAIREPEAEESYTIGAEEPVEKARDVEASKPPKVGSLAERRGASRRPDPPLFDADEDLDDDSSDDGDFDDDPVATEETSKAHTESGVMWAILLSLGLVLLGYGALTEAFFADPAWCDEVLGHLPFVSGTGSDRLLTRKVALAEVTGTHQSVKDDKNVFVLSGKAYNTSAEPMVNVQILGTLYDATGKDVAHKAIHLGNIISPKVLTEMTRKEIEVFHGLNVWHNIDPGQTYPFVIVFTDPPKNAIDFTVKVTGALHQRS